MSWHGPVARTPGFVLTRFAFVAANLVSVLFLWAGCYGILGGLLAAGIVDGTSSASSRFSRRHRPARPSGALLILLFGPLSTE